MSTLQAPHPIPKASLRDANADRIAIGHVLVDNYSFEQATSAIITYALSGGAPAYVVTPNAQHVVLLDRNRLLREVYHNADLIVPDGISLLLAARVFGKRLRQRVTGVDLFQSLCELAAQNNLRVFLLGGRPGSADLTAATMKRQYPMLQISTWCPPFGFENDPDEARRMADAVHRAQPDLLFVGLGTPKQEKWIFEHGLKLGAAVTVGVGGTFEMVGGIVSRAPLGIQKLGLEWLHRLLMEPRRMWRRYLIGNIQFCGIIVIQGFRKTVLSVLVSLLHRQNFAAELKEPQLRKETYQLISRLNMLSENLPPVNTCP
jgi:N-acetylglucosaminyldiphosphoundecaprenol N-acetyl-beta-D-mannosaminyltransferase